MKTFPEKLNKKLPEGFTDNVNSMDTDEIKKLILLSEGNIYNIQGDLDTNEKILEMKENLKEAVSPYREGMAGEKAKIVYCLWVMQERGMEIGNGVAE